MELQLQLHQIKLAPRGAWLRQKSCQEISCTIVALLVLRAVGPQTAHVFGGRRHFQLWRKKL
jgi:hypothetical protein